MYNFRFQTHFRAKPWSEAQNTFFDVHPTIWREKRLCLFIFCATICSVPEIVAFRGLFIWPALFFRFVPKWWRTEPSCQPPSLATLWSLFYFIFKKVMGSERGQINTGSNIELGKAWTGHFQCQSHINSAEWSLSFTVTVFTYFQEALQHSVPHCSSKWTLTAHNSELPVKSLVQQTPVSCLEKT